MGCSTGCLCQYKATAARRVLPVNGVEGEVGVRWVLVAQRARGRAIGRKEGEDRETEGLTAPYRTKAVTWEEPWNANAAARHGTCFLPARNCWKKDPMCELQRASAS